MIKKIKFKNKRFKKATIKELIYTSFVNYGKTRTFFLIDKLKNLGFYYATKSGLSISIEDLKIPSKKQEFIHNSNVYVNKSKFAYTSGQLNYMEKSNRILNSWALTTNLLTQSLITLLQKSDPFNSLHLMVFSGARGNISQVTQLLGMRGLMSDSNGQLIEIPIIHNFREGLTLIEYLMSTYGSRKGIVDTALKTADAGYLTRRLVNSANDVIIRDLDCSTYYFIKIYKSNLKTNFVNQLLGRTSVESIYDFTKQKFLVYKNTCITEKIANNLYFCSILYIRVYSILTCTLENSICKKCYGWDMTLQQPIKLGDAIGVIAAQSIGEPGTQLTMRTFHTGGSFSLSTSRQIIAKYTGIIIYSKDISIEKFRTKEGNFANHVLKSISIKLINYKNIIEHILLNLGSILYISNHQFILKDTLIAEITIREKVQHIKSMKSIIAPHSGEIFLLPQLNLMSLLKGQIYTFPNKSFLNTFSNLQKFNKPYFIFYFKIYSLVAGFLDHLSTRNNFKNICIVNELHIFIFPIFWDKLLKKIIFLDLYKKYFILEQIPIFLNKQIYIFSKQKTLRYDCKQTGSLSYKNKLYKSLKYFKTDIISSNLILLYTPCKYFFGNTTKSNLIFTNNIYTKTSIIQIHKKIFIQKKGFFHRKQTLSNTLETLKPGYLFEYTMRIFKNFNQNFTNKIFFTGEIVQNIIIKNLTKIEITQFKNLFYILLRPITFINIVKNKKFKKFGFLSLTFISKTFFIPNFKKLDYFIYNGQSISLIKLSLWIKSKKYFLQFNKLYTINNSNFLRFTSYIINTIKSTSYKINRICKMQSKLYEYLLKKTLINFFSYHIKNFSKYKVLKKKLSVNSRLLIVTINHFFTYFFETIKQIKQIKNYITYNSIIAPFVKTFISGKIYCNNSFSISLHSSTSFYISANTQIFNSSKSYINYGEILGFIYFEQIVTSDIIQGLPKLEELLELRITNTSLIYAYNSGIILTLNMQNNINCILQNKINKYINTQINILPPFYFKKKLLEKFYSKPYDFISIGQILTFGAINFKILLNIVFLSLLQWQTMYSAVYSSFKRIQILLIKKIKLIYSKQNVLVSIKHLEVIVKQLTSYVKIIYENYNSFYVGELIKITYIVNINTVFRLCRKKCIYYEPIIMGITKISLQTNSFLSATSFQNTIKNLTIAALEGKIDWFFGIKENMMIGQNLPIGKFY